MTEPEEIIEAKLVALLAAAVPAVDVLGAITPALEGEMKLSPDTYISVFVDLASQDLDFIGPGIPCTYSVRIAVRYASADDKTGSGFRDTCRSVRGAIADLLGDGCSALDGEGFSCDSFIVGSTSTEPLLSADNDGMVKTYNATIAGRYCPVDSTDASSTDVDETEENPTPTENE